MFETYDLWVNRMFVCNFKLSNRKLIPFLAVLVLCIAAVIALKFDSLSDSAETAAKFTDETAVADYLVSFGLEIGSFTVDEITVPAEFKEVYKSYNELQRSQGFDLTEYKGKTLTRYTCPVQNYPGQDENVFAEVLIFDNAVVGADIYSTNADGFMSALK